MALNESQIDQIVEQVVRKLSKELSDLPQPSREVARPHSHHADDRRTAERRYGVSPVIPGTPAAPGRAPSFHRGRPGIFDDLDSATAAAQAAFEKWERTPIDVRDRVIEAMREVTRRNAEALSHMAVEETGLGNVRDKIQKNLLCANKTPGTEILRPVAFSGDHGLTLTERAPYGVIGAITPSTNPTENLINNGISTDAGGTWWPGATPWCSTCTPAPRRSRRTTSSCSTRRSSRRAARRTSCAASASRPSTRRRR